MDFLTALLFGLLQGLSEFLPVSSSGHLVIGQKLIDVEPTGIVLEVFLHLGTLLAVLVFYKNTVFSLVVGAFKRKEKEVRYLGKLVVGTLPVATLAVFARDIIQGAFELGWVTGVSLIVTGCVLFSIKKPLATRTEREPSWSEAWWIGCAQAIAILPGISRSGVTVSAALAFGISFKSAAEFSFMLSLLAISGATVMSVPEFFAEGKLFQSSLFFGAFVAAISGFVALGLFIRFLRSGTLHRFAYYDWIVGVLFLVWLFVE